MDTHNTRNSIIDIDKWREIVNDWNKSIESQKSYCERIGVNLHTFSYVRNKLLNKSKPKVQFAPLIVKNNDKDNDNDKNNVLNHPSIILENTRGYKLHFPTSLSSDQLIQLFTLSGWNDA